MRALLLIVLTIVVSSANSFALDLGGWFSGSGDIAKKKAEGTYREARSAYGSADYTKCIELASKAIEQYPEMAKAFALRGKAKKDMGDLDNAFKDLNKAIELDPNLGEAYFVRAQTYEIMGEMDKAASNYKKGCSAGFKDACR